MFKFWILYLLVGFGDDDTQALDPKVSLRITLQPYAF
jgi:hypothetical protein